jgi:response regulator NasT
LELELDDLRSLGIENCVSDPDDEHAKSQAKRSRALRIGLLENGFNLIATLPGDVFLADRINQLQPDLIIVDAESEARDALEHVVFATRDARRPIVMFTDDSDTSHVKDAVAVGVSAYIVDGLASSRIKPILEVAMARFEYEERLRSERDQTRSDLEDRTVLDRAKVFNDEPFGPMASIRSFNTLDEAITEANRLAFGLAGYAFTKSLKNADLLARRVEVGMLWMKMPAMPSAELPFGGIKDSGYGSEGGTEAMDAYLNARAVTIMNV